MLIQVSDFITHLFEINLGDNCALVIAGIEAMADARERSDLAFQCTVVRLQRFECEILTFFFVESALLI